MVFEQEQLKQKEKRRGVQRNKFTVLVIFTHFFYLKGGIPGKGLVRFDIPERKHLVLIQRDEMIPRQGVNHIHAIQFQVSFATELGLRCRWIYFIHNNVCREPTLVSIAMERCRKKCSPIIDKICRYKDSEAV